MHINKVTCKYITDYPMVHIIIGKTSMQLQISSYRSKNKRNSPNKVEIVMKYSKQDWYNYLIRL